MGSNVFIPAIPTGLVKVFSTTKTDAAATSWNISSSLNLDITKQYYIIFKLILGVQNARPYLFVNNDTTVTNYYNQYHRVIGAVVAAGIENNPAIAVLNQNSATHFIECQLTFTAAGIPIMRCNTVGAAASTNVFLCTSGWCKTAAVTSITQIDLGSDGTVNQYQTGCSCQIFEVKG